MKNLTPKHLRRTKTMSLPAVYELEDGQRLLIVGKQWWAKELPEGIELATGEAAIVIDRALLANVIANV
jgi:hypothetical protein